MMYDVVCVWILRNATKMSWWLGMRTRKDLASRQLARFVGSQSRIHAKQIETVQADLQTNRQHSLDGHKRSNSLEDDLYSSLY
jgi:hypothetical protein